MARLPFVGAGVAGRSVGVEVSTLVSGDTVQAESITENTAASTSKRKMGCLFIILRNQSLIATCRIIDWQPVTHSKYKLNFGYISKTLNSRWSPKGIYV